jgi:diguanylate cyclase (GGDEF)-like protein
MTEEWVVVLEAANGAGDAVIESGLVDRLLEEVADCKPGILYVPDRLALQLRLVAGNPLDAHLNALTRWRRAMRAVDDPPLGILRIEILTADELERDCLSMPAEERPANGARHATEHDRRAEALLRRALEDADTGLPSAEVFRGYVHEALMRPPPAGAVHAVLVLDLRVLPAAPTAPERTWGAVMCETARRLADATRPTDRAARMGDDKFAVLLESIRDRDAVAVAERVLRAACAPFPAENDPVAVLGGSVGIALSRPETDADALVREAAAAMCAAKAAGGGHCQLFHPGMPPPDPATVGLCVRPLP